MNEKILKALRGVNYPGYERDIVDFRIVSGAEMEGNRITVGIKNILKPEIRAALEKDIRETLLKTFPGKTVSVSFKESGAEEKKEKKLSNIKHVIAVGSGKGGVGKSTVAVNLARAMAGQGASVGLLDADIWGPSVHILTGKEKGEIFVNENKKMIPVESHGMHVMSIGFFIEENNPVIWRGPLVVGALRQLMDDVAWPDLDYLFIDMPPGTGDIQLSLAQDAKIDGIVIITTPQKVAYVDAIKGILMFRKMDMPVIGIVENMSYFQCPDTGKKYPIFGEGGGDHVSEKYGVPLLGRIPIEEIVVRSSDEGAPVVDRYPDSLSAKAYGEIASTITRYFNG